MATPLATIADALIEFILSLLRDPGAVAELNDDPEGTLARNGLSGVCSDDVRAVMPVVVDHPQVAPRSNSHPSPTPDPRSNPPEVVREFQNIVNSFHIDNRSTIIDQSVNQSIWAEGDVTQIFDQEAVVASGDQSVAAGDDAAVDNSQTDITAGDIAIGNTDTTTTIDGSFNDGSTTTTTDTDIDGASEGDTAPLDATPETDAATALASATDAASTAVAAAEAAPAEAEPVEAPPAPPEAEPAYVEPVEIVDDYESATEVVLEDPAEFEFDEP